MNCEGTNKLLHVHTHTHAYHLHMDVGTLQFLYTQCVTSRVILSHLYTHTSQLTPTPPNLPPHTVQTDQAVSTGCGGKVLGGSVHPRLPVSVHPSGLHTVTNVDVYRWPPLRLHPDTRDTGLAERHASLLRSKQWP